MHDVAWATKHRITRVYELGLAGKAPYPHQVEGIQRVLKALVAGNQKRFLHYYAPRTGKTFVQAALAYWLLMLRKELRFSLVVIVNDREFLDTQSFEAVDIFLRRLRAAGNPWQTWSKLRRPKSYGRSWPAAREVLPGKMIAPPSCSPPSRSSTPRSWLLSAQARLWLQGHW
ncbi:unnamed protein product [Effrenium voratum]|nr:unnamed protein product [Effrenium voratum]